MLCLGHKLYMVICVYRLVLSLRFVILQRCIWFYIDAAFLPQGCKLSQSTFLKLVYLLFLIACRCLFKTVHSQRTGTKTDGQQPLCIDPTLKECPPHCSTVLSTPTKDHFYYVFSEQSRNSIELLINQFLRR